MVCWCVYGSRETIDYCNDKVLKDYKHRSGRVTKTEVPIFLSLTFTNPLRRKLTHPQFLLWNYNQSQIMIKNVDIGQLGTFDGKFVQKISYCQRPLGSALVAECCQGAIVL